MLLTVCVCVCACVCACVCVCVVCQFFWVVADYHGASAAIVVSPQVFCVIMVRGRWESWERSLSTSKRIRMAVLVFVVRNEAIMFTRYDEQYCSYQRVDEPHRGEETWEFDFHHFPCVYCVIVAKWWEGRITYLLGIFGSWLLCHITRET